MVLQKLDEETQQETLARVKSRQSTVQEILTRDTDAFIDAVDARNVPFAWQILSTKIIPDLRRLDYNQRRIWIRRALVQPKLHQFRRECTEKWIEALQSDSLSTHPLPSPYSIVLMLEELSLGKPVFYRSTLWGLAEGINDLRISHPNVDLQPAVRELMNLWRLCHLVAITTKSRTKQLHLNTLRDASDWSFLPPETVFATSSARDHADHFDQLLTTVVFLGNETEGSLARSDYTSPALVTLDLVRTTQGVLEDGRMGVCSELDELKPWVRLMEALLRVAAPGRVPFELRGKLVGESDEVRERYWRLLRRVGVRREIVEAEARDPVYQRGPLPPGSTSTVSMSRTSRRDAEESPLEQQQQQQQQQHQQHQQHQQQQQQQQQQQDQHQHQQQDPPAEKKEPHIKFVNPPVDPLIAEFSLRQIKHLGRALDQNDIHQAEKLRRGIAAFAGSNNRAPTALPIEVYEHLIMVLFALSIPQSAIEVWKKFTEDGYIPTVKTYTVLMQGATHAHDVTTLEKFWHAMRFHAGLQPDSHAWSTRVKGLFSAKLPQKGLAALTEMGREWYTAARNAEYTSAGLPIPDPKKGSGKKKTPSTPEPTLPSLLAKYPDAIENVPRPGLVVLNSAIAGLASAHHHSEVPKVLQWARIFSIEPDLITYNALLNICMRFSRGEEALNLLRQMQAKGIEADSTTWTVLLTALFQSGFLDNLEGEAQTDKIMSFIKSVETEGDDGKITGGLDVKGYALIIDRLLKHHNNTPAAARILNYMSHVAELRPSTQIYTILMTSYFYPPNNSPPDWNAISTLYTQATSPDPRTGFPPPLDAIFYDRMIEGYADFHSVVGGHQPAMDLLAIMGEKGMKPGFGALEKVGRMLVERGEWGLWRRIVETVGRRERGAKVWQRQRRFWEFVQESGVLGEGVGVQEWLSEVGKGGRGRGSWREGERL